MSELNIGKIKLYELLASGELEAIRLGRRTLILQDSIDALVERLGSRRFLPVGNPRVTFADWVRISDTPCRI